MSSPRVLPDLQTLLGVAVAPFGVKLSGDLAAHMLRHKVAEADAENVAIFLAASGFKTEILETLEGVIWPVLVWQGRQVCLRKSDGRWMGVNGRGITAPSLTGNETFLAVTGLKEEEEMVPTSVGGMLKNFKRELALIAVFGVLINGIGLAIPLFSMTVYDRVLPVSATNTLWLLTLGVGMALAFDIVLRLIRGGVLAALLARENLWNDRPLLARLLRQRSGVGQADQLEMMRLGHEVREQMILHILPTLADVPFVLIFVLAIGMIAPTLLPVPLVLITLTLVIQAALLPKLRLMARTLSHVAHQRMQVLLETFRSSTATRLFNRQHEALARWDIHAAGVVRSETQGQFWSGLGQHVTVTAAQLSFVLTLIVGAELVMNGKLTIGALVATSLLCSRAISPALHLIDTLTRLQGVKAHLRMLRHGLRVPTETLMPTAEKPETLATCRGEVTLQGLGLARKDKEARGILQEVNVRFGAGERWAIAGGNGAGKSSLLGLMVGLSEPSDGEIFLDGISYARLPISEVRRHVMLVTQSPVFADVTVREVMCGLEIPDEARLQEVLQVSGLGEVLAAQGAGLEFRAGPNADKLSGGQKQMLALAAALYAEPKVLMLDEPTSQYDPDAERAFVARLQGWLKGRTTTLILVTHRPELLALVEHMVVLVQGRVVMGGRKTDVLKQLQANQPTPMRKVDHGRAA